MAPCKSFHGKKQEKKLLVLDLDETLVHTRHEMFGEEADLSFTLVENGCNYYVKVRPGARSFLEMVSKIFDVAIFTASEKEYADKIIDFLDPKSTLISRRLYGKSGKNLPDGGFVKDLSVLEHDFAKLAIIDNCPHAYRLQKSNGIPIKSWYVEPNDGELASLIPFLERLAAVEDVRPVIAERFGCHNKGGATKKKNTSNASGSSINLKCKGPAVEDVRPVLAESFDTVNKKKNSSGSLVKEMENLKCKGPAARSAEPKALKKKTAVRLVDF